MGRHIPECLLRTLLVRAGIEKNPGPWFCSVFQNRLHHRSVSVRRNRCMEWVHFRSCSGLTSLREYSHTGYVARCCANIASSGSQASPSASSSSDYVTPPPSTPVRQFIQRQHPSPTIARPMPGSASFLQLNCNGLRGKIDEIVDFMTRKSISVAAIQEIKLTNTCSLYSCHGYNVLRKDRSRNGGGGLAFVIHHSVQYRPISPALDASDPYMECMEVAVRSGTAEIEKYNVYIPPVGSCVPINGQAYNPDISGLLSGHNRLVLGDFNAHHTSWHSPLGNDQRGRALAEQIDSSTFCTVNEDAPTRITRRCSSAPDISIASPDLLSDVYWQAVISLGSGHLPIILTIDRPPDFITSERRTFINYKKADWSGFREYTNRRFSELPPPSDVLVAERKFRDIINAAAARFIPAGRIPQVRPNFPAQAVVLADERDGIRAMDPANPRISELNLEINRVVNEHKRNLWLEHLEQCNLAPV
ncbi:uncharacterized protein LOC131995697 [Stomoxys calcitrans]|uniref:uncharacterized protein LOC131995697 n=1 Tax=Stomoxys calcitrans TaxID=35570 RepID=UPI0027E21963|nr:uncharacterized protein LOC131995697 [Stomoxys calcitrans]